MNKPPKLLDEATEFAKECLKRAESIVATETQHYSKDAIPLTGHLACIIAEYSNTKLMISASLMSQIGGQEDAGK